MRYRTRVPNYCMVLLRKRGYVMISRTNIKYLLTFLIVIVIAFTVWGVTGANASKPVGQKYYVSITIKLFVFIVVLYNIRMTSRIFYSILARIFEQQVYMILINHFSCYKFTNKSNIIA
jgi:hypothetical protein